MGIAERREREREALRTRIVEVARDIVSEQGLDALSMRSIAERIEYSPATIYLYFRDKGELLDEVIRAGFALMGEYIDAEVAARGHPGNAAGMLRTLGRAYARFGLENTAYFRVMFELPTDPCTMETRVDCPARRLSASGDPDELVQTVQRAIDEGLYDVRDAQSGSLVAWSLIHGLTSLYLSGHLAWALQSHDDFLDAVEAAMDMLGGGISSRETTREEAS